MKSSGHTWNAPRAIMPRLATAVDREMDGGRKSELFVNTLWVLDYAKGRVGWSRTGSARAPWRPREPHIAHLYPPLTPYWEDSTRDADAVLRETYILFYGGENAGLTRFIRSRFRYARFHDRGGVLLELLERIARIGHTRGEAGFWEAQALFCRAVDLLQRAEHTADENYLLPLSAEAPAPSSLAAEVEDYLRRNLAQRIRLSALAKQFHLSVSSLAHRYRLEAGEAPMAKLIKLRVNMAKGLLLTGQRLDLVAGQTGFYDAYHLSKTFKRLVGLPPRKFVLLMRKRKD